MTAPAIPAAGRMFAPGGVRLRPACRRLPRRRRPLPARQSATVESLNGLVTPMDRPDPVAHPTAPLQPLMIGWSVMSLSLGLVMRGFESAWAPVIYGSIYGGYLLALNGISWLLAPMLITQLTVNSAKVPGIGISLALLTTLVAAGLGLAAIMKAPLTSPVFVRVMLPALLFMMVALGGNLAHADFDSVFKYARWQLTQILTLVLFATLIKEKRDLKRLALFALGVGIASTIAAILQHYWPGSAPYGERKPFDLSEGRSIGLAELPVVYANQMGFLLAPLVAFIAATWTPRDRRIYLFVAAGVFLLAGIYVSQTRSTLLALAAGIAVGGLFLGGIRGKALFGGLLAAFLLFQVLATAKLINPRFLSSGDDSYESHEALLMVGIQVGLDNFLFGIGHENFEEVSLEYKDEVEGKGAGALGVYRAHNDFVTVWTSWGIFALIGYVGMILAAFWNYWVACRKGDTFIKAMAVAAVAGYVRYITESTFHNALDNGTFLWMHLGLSIALVEMANRYPAVRAGIPVPWDYLVERRRRRVAG